MTIYEAYVNGKLYPSVTRQSVIFYCELYGAFQEIREKMGYTDAIYTTADLKSTSEATVKKAISLAKSSIEK